VTTDFAHAHEELTTTHWPAHLAGAAAGLACCAAWMLLTLVSPSYLAPYGDQQVALDPLGQLVLQAAITFGGASTWIVLAGIALLVLLLWNVARKSGGASTVVLFVLAGLGAAGAIIVVLACGSAMPEL
jgi:hypothetical protein